MSDVLISPKLSTYSHEQAYRLKTAFRKALNARAGPKDPRRWGVVSAPANNARLPPDGNPVRRRSGRAPLETRALPAANRAPVGHALPNLVPGPRPALHPARRRGRGGR